MHPFATLAAAAAGLFAGFQLAKHLRSGDAQTQRAKSTQQNRTNARAKARGAKDLGDLVHDPETGVYSPRKS